MKFITVNHEDGQIYLINYSMVELFASFRHSANVKRMREITNNTFACYFTIHKHFHKLGPYLSNEGLRLQELNWFVKDKKANKYQNM